MDVKHEYSPMMIRLPADLKEWLRAQARANYRTMNAELVKRLRDSSARGGEVPTPQGGKHDSSGA
ncbi:Arc family DNA-binding protein [Xenophilus aerolatus]|nr:Arc family DNA-binding protein [Xenophilus aerolatus]